MAARSTSRAAPKLTWLPASRRTSNGPRLGQDPAVAVAQVARQVVVEPVPAPLRFQRQREGGVGVDGHGLERVHLDRDGERHGREVSGWAGRALRELLLASGTSG